MNTWVSDDILKVAKVLVDNGYLPNVHHTGSLDWKRMFVIEASTGMKIGQINFERGQLKNRKPHNIPEIRALPIWNKIRQELR